MQNSKIHFKLQMLGFQTLWFWNGGPLNIRQNFQKMLLLFGSKMGIFDIFLKRLYAESFENLQ